MVIFLKTSQREKRAVGDGMWERKYKELQVTLADEKKKLDEGLQIAEKQRTEAKETFEEVKFKKARLIEDRSKFNSVKANLENRAQEGVKMVKIKKEAVEKFHENMLEREEKLSKERRNFTAEKRKLKETLKASIFGRNRDPDWTPPSTKSPNKRLDSSSSSCAGSSTRLLADTNPSVHVPRTCTPVPVSRPTGQNNNEISADVKPEIKLEAKPVRDPTFDRFDPSRTRPILDRGAKRRFSDIIIID